MLSIINLIKDSNLSLNDLSKILLETSKQINIKVNNPNKNSLIEKPNKPIVVSLNYAPFDEFWKRYPKKVGKRAAYKVWDKLSPNIDDVMYALSWQINSAQWQKGFIPNPETYLNQGRWMDEPDNNGDPF